MIRLTIDQREVQVEEGVTILTAAAHAGIRIPTLCYHEKLLPFGACRLCVVEVEQMKGRLIPACSTPVAEGMVVRTGTEQIIKARKTVLELLLIHHPLDCPFCDKAGECRLQDLVYEYGITRNRFKDKKSAHPIDYVSPLVERNTNRCVLCGMCVRICDEVVGASELSMVNRGIRTKVATDFDRPLNCEFCGECENICPVGALTDRLFKFRARAWEVDNMATVCSFCSTGCALKLSIKNGQIVRVLGADEGAANQGSLCTKGRFGYGYVNSPERITRPLVRKNGALVETGWEEALRTVAEGLNGIKAAHGPDAIAGLCSARLTNEEAYIFQKFMRLVIGTNQLDNSGGYSHRGFSQGLRDSFRERMTIPSIADLKNCDVMLIIRSNVSETHPVVGYQVTAAAKQHDAQLIVADPRRIKLARLASSYLAHWPGTEIHLLNGLAYIILQEGLENKEFIAAQTEGIQELSHTLKTYTPAFVAHCTGVAAQDLIKAARIFATAGRAAIIISTGMGCYGDDAALVHSAANLALITGHVDRAGSGVLVLGEKSNSHGIIEMGALPDGLPGLRSAADAAAREVFEKAWGAPLPTRPGLAAEQILEGAGQGAIKALYCVGENPLHAYPDTHRNRDALTRLQLLVVQDLFMSPTAQMAHVVLPAVSFAEKEGTYINCEGRIQRVRKALEPRGEAQSDAEIICAVARAMGKDLGDGKAERIQAEISSLIPRYRCLNAAQIPLQGIKLEPVSAEPAAEALPARARLIPVEGTAPPAPTAEFPFVLMTGSSLFHCGFLSTHSPAIRIIAPEARLDISPQDARMLGINSGEFISVTSTRGSMTVKARITAQQPPGMVFVPYHFAQPAVHALTGGWQPYALVKIAKQQ
jgi:NADH-quinone oxidoreductase chain G